MEELLNSFITQFREDRTKLLVIPRRRACITTSGGIPIGWVSRHVDDGIHGVICIDINICEDPYIEISYGTAAIIAWIDYRFENSNAQRLNSIPGH